MSKIDKLSLILKSLKDEFADKPIKFCIEHVTYPEGNDVAFAEITFTTKDGDTSKSVRKYTFTEEDAKLVA